MASPASLNECSFSLIFATFPTSVNGAGYQRGQHGSTPEEGAAQTIAGGHNQQRQ